MENPSIWKYPDELIDQMGVLITPFKEYLESNTRSSLISRLCLGFMDKFDTSQGLLHNPEKCESELVALALQRKNPKQS